MEYVYYFGYGANRDLDMIKAITGVDPVWVKEGILKNYALYLQPLNSILDPSDFGQKDSLGARTRLQQKWNSQFKSYVVKKSKGDSVAGTIWKLSTRDLRLINDWELVDFGWYNIGLGQAETNQNEKYTVYVQYLSESSDPGDKVDGKNYQTYINDKEEMLEVARGLRKRIKKELTL